MSPAGGFSTQSRDVSIFPVFQRQEKRNVPDQLPFEDQINRDPRVWSPVGRMVEPRASPGLHGCRPSTRFARSGRPLDLWVATSRAMAPRLKPGPGSRGRMTLQELLFDHPYRIRSDRIANTALHDRQSERHESCLSHWLRGRRRSRTWPQTTPPVPVALDPVQAQALAPVQTWGVA